MVDESRVERIRSEVRAAALADDLIARVADQTFKEIVTLIRARVTEVETLFLDKIDSVPPRHQEWWLAGTEKQLAGELASLRYYEEAAQAREYNIELI